MNPSQNGKKLYICSNCGTVSAVHASACPQCGADKTSGWTETAPETTEDPSGREYIKTVSPFRRYFWNVKSAVAVVTAAAFFFLMLPRYEILTVLLIFFGMVTALAFCRKMPLRRGRRENQLYRELLKMAGGDRQLADRLIDKERKRTPHAGKEELIQEAITSWRRDLR